MIEKFYKRLHDSIMSSDLIAYKYYSEEVTYRDLYGQMRKINYYLAPYGKKRIVLYGGKSPSMYAAIYSIILSGNTWVPFPQGHPDNRLLEMLKVLDADVLIFEDTLPRVIIEFAKDKNIMLRKLSELLREKKEREFEGFKFSQDDIAYIMFTSGSTGTPKGVQMTHGNYINFVNNAMGILPFRKGEIFSDYHEFAFDISIFYLFCAPLTESAIAPILNNEEKIFPVNHLIQNKVTVCSSVPSLISRIQRLRPKEEILNDIDTLFLCGEPLSLNVLRYCYENLKVKNVYNFYGLTETGVENFYHKCSPEDLDRYELNGFVPIGRPLNGNEVKITQEKELLLSGCQITPGYLGGVGKERFTLIDGKRYYHTGDIVEEAGDVYFCKGRLDSQVKLSGYRVELMDIEVHVKRYPRVKEAACFVDSRRNLKSLICACEIEAGNVSDAQDIKKQLLKNLPEYMVPKEIFVLDEMPRNNNGKLDRKQIKEIYSITKAKIKSEIECV